MKRSKLVTWIIALVIISAVLVIWKWSYHTPIAEQPKSGAKPAVSSEADKVGQVQKPADANKPAAVKEPNEPNKPADVNKPSKTVEPNEPNKPSEPLEALNLKDVEMKDIIQKLAEWTGKPIIPADDAMKQKMTIYSAEKLPRSQALSLIYGALRAKGFVAEHTDNAIYIKPIKDAKLSSAPTIPPEQPLADIENKEQIVRKFFKLKNYSATQMGNIVKPLVGEYGYVSTDEVTSTLLVIDTVDNLLRLEKIIEQFDVPEAEQTVEKVFEVRHGDPAEIVQLLRILLGGEGRRKVSGPSAKSETGPDRGGPARDKGKAEGTASETTSVVVGPSQSPIILIPEPRRKWIIARASAENMKQIEEWIDKLDKEEPVASEYETVSIRYVNDVREVANRLNDALQQMPGAELKASVLIQPLEQARQIMIFGRPELREMVKKLIQEIDVPSGQFETKAFKLKYADPDQVKKNIDELYEDINAKMPYWGRRWQEGMSAETVRAIAFPTMQQVTVIASPENMRKIEKQIKEWDEPINAEQVKPLIVTLHNSDPVQMADLLTKLFTEEAPSSRRMPYWWDWDGGEEEKKKGIVGPLYGQLTFEAVPGTKKIIVISKMPGAYEVIEKLIKELDRQEMAEVPKVITLNYADPEELAQRLNAIFNEAGQMATIPLGQRGLSQTGLGQEEEKGSKAGNEDEGTGSAGFYTPPWTRGQRRTDEMPLSNIIGRIRFIPDPRSKAILVLAPPEFMENIVKMIKELDIPGKQVMIKAVIMEVDHRDLTSLGLQLAQDPSTFGTLDENAITALTSLTHLATHGSLVLNKDAVPPAEGTGTRLGVGADITVLIDFLVKKVNAKILNQQTLWTKDNEEADFFKGQKVAFNTQLSVSEQGGRVTSGIDFQRVGMTLRVRPSITPEKHVDMNVNLTISQRTSEFINAQPVRTEMETETTLIVKDGETVMLGGMLFQEDSLVERKIALLGDLPLVGGLFRHNETVLANNEMIVFITPYVIDVLENMLPETKEQLEDAKEKLETVLKQLRTDEVNEVDE